MASKKKLLQAAAGAAGGEVLDIDEVFSTYLYEGNSSTQTITNGIDLSGEGGLVWTKNRDSAFNHFLYDTERGVNKYLISDSTIDQQSVSGTLTAFNSNGFTLGANDYGNITNGNAAVSWTFRKAPKFFDVVTYTGDGVAGRTISHNLDNLVGMLIIKCTSHASDWSVQHRMLNPDKYLALNETNSAQTDTARFYNTAAGTSTFTVGSGNAVNGLGRTYVAYLFSHHNSGNPGEFGPDADQDIIKCGSYTGNGSSTGPSVNLGFEPQWIMIKKTNSSQNAHWYVFDAMRGIVTGGDDPYLYANNTNAEVAGNVLEVTPTGFQLNTSANGFNGSGDTYIYMAIRRGPLAEPENATDVFAIDNQTASSAPFLTSNFAVDMVLRKDTAGGNSEVMSRLTQGKALLANSFGAEAADSVAQFDFNDGCLDNTSTDTSRYGWMWKRAPSYFDVVTYTGTGSNRTVSHNLNAVPEMMWVRPRNLGENWAIYHKDIGATKYLQLNSTNAAATSPTRWNDTTPTSSVFSLGTDNEVNASGGYNYIAYLFATLAGISKVGSYTGNGSTQNIDCGFSSGARFVLIKRTDVSEGWKVHDSVRGIVAGNDPFVELNNTNAENSSFDLLDPYSSGFAVNNYAGWNASGGSYIFYAIA